MFTIDANLHHLRVRRDRVLSIAESVNQPHVVVPGREAQGTLAYIVGVRNADASAAIYVYLWLTRVRESVIYVLDDGRLDPAAFPDAEREAFDFCESMGFMMEGLQYRKLDAEAQAELLTTLPPFQADPAPPRLEASPALRPLPGGPTMNDPAITAVTPGPEVAVEFLGALEDPSLPEPADTSGLARLLASF